MPTPVISQLGHLSLPPWQYVQSTPTLQFTQPANDVAGFSVAPYYTDGIQSFAEGWARRVLKAADFPLLPILYTPAYLVACPSTDINGLNSDAQATLRLPPSSAGQKNTVIRLPRIITFPVRPKPYGLTEARQWVRANASWLDAHGIAVMGIGSQLGFVKWLEEGLPSSGRPTELNTAQADRWGFVLNATSFVAGQVFSFRAIQADYQSDLSGQVAANGVAINTEAFPRFAKRQVAGAYLGLAESVFTKNVSLASQLAGYGFLPLTNLAASSYAAGTLLGFYNGMTATVKSFFGLV